MLEWLKVYAWTVVVVHASDHEAACSMSVAVTVLREISGSKSSLYSSAAVGTSSSPLVILCEVTL